MSTSQTLTTEQIKQYQQLVQEQGISAVPGVYAALNNMGFCLVLPYNGGTRQ